MQFSSPMELFKKNQLYPVTCETLSNGKSDEAVVEAMLAGGARVVQLRDKVSSKWSLFQKAKRIKQITKRYGALLIINDYLEVAFEVESEGVHLGQQDLPVQIAKRETTRLNKELIIGVSCHSLAQALTAEANGADYVNLGPIFPTKTKRLEDTVQRADPRGHFVKPELIPALGTEIISEAAAQLKIPFTVMGGIKETHLPELVRQGARQIAMITEITQKQDDIKAQVAHLIAKLNALIQQQK